jgi:hypothetical protein
MQAKDVDAATLIQLVGRFPYGISWTYAALEPEMQGIPAKVVHAKLKSLVKRDIIDGCSCGCAGRFRLKEYP